MMRIKLSIIRINISIWFLLLLRLILVHEKAHIPNHLSVAIIRTIWILVKWFDLIASCVLIVLMVITWSSFLESLMCSNYASITLQLWWQRKAMMLILSNLSDYCSWIIVIYTISVKLIVWIGSINSNKNIREIFHKISWKLALKPKNSFRKILE